MPADWKPSPQRTAGDRRITSIHEAGHYVIARHFKVYGWAWIGPSNDKLNPDWKMWTGQFQYPGFRMDRLSDIRRQMVAAAGAVAEKCWDHQFDVDMIFEDWCFDIWDGNWMSGSDWRLSGHEPGWATPKLVRACEAVYDLLVPGGLLWPQLLTASRALIDNGEIGEHLQTQHVRDGCGR